MFVKFEDYKSVLNKSFDRFKIKETGKICFLWRAILIFDGM